MAPESNERLPTRFRLDFSVRLGEVIFILMPVGKHRLDGNEAVGALEDWQQESAGAITKRLLVASMSCVVVWRLARLSGPEPALLRSLLVRLSGRQMKRDRPVTEPALLAGFQTMLAMLDLLEHFDVQELRRLVALALPFHDSGWSCVDTHAQATVNVTHGTSAIPDCGFGRGSGWACPLRSTARTRNS